MEGDSLKNKVEITGVNTAELKVLDPAETMKLIEQAHLGDESARDEVVLGNLKLVLSVIKKFNYLFRNSSSISFL